MNVLQMIKEQKQRKEHLSKAQFLMSKTYRGSSYSSAHQAPTSKAQLVCSYRGVGYIK